MGDVDSHTTHQGKTTTTAESSSRFLTLEQQEAPSVTTTREYPFQPLETADADLPFIEASLVTSKRRPRLIAPKPAELESFSKRQDWWLVIDNVVYDCTDFVLEHPGGAQVIVSFIGEDCSWQFRRFHTKSVMEQYGRQLRIGRTDGSKIVQRFQEKKRWVGMNRLGGDEW